MCMVILLVLLLLGFLPQSQGQSLAHALRLMSHVLQNETRSACPLVPPSDLIPRSKGYQCAMPPVQMGVKLVAAPPSR